MFLFILESIGTSELILIGIIALIFLGPRKLPQIAKTIGKTLADFRTTTNDFKSTWQREVDFEEEAEALRTGDLPESKPLPVPRIDSKDEPSNTIAPPDVRAVQSDLFADVPTAEDARNTTDGTAGETAAEPPTTTDETADELSDKRNWL